MAKYNKAKDVYTCCGKYYAVAKDVSEKGTKIKCQYCGKTLNAPVQVPYILYVTSK